MRALLSAMRRYLGTSQFRRHPPAVCYVSLPPEPDKETEEDRITNVGKGGETSFSLRYWGVISARSCAQTIIVVGPTPDDLDGSHVSELVQLAKALRRSLVCH